jgi:uncharacterized protein YbbK (DUF523 family)
MRRAPSRPAAVAPKADRGRPGRLAPKLADQRSGRVVFLSHCMLNQHTRYPGGAFRAGAVMEVAGPYLRDGAGICQLPCPEQAAWGGVGKRYLVFFWGRPWLRPLARAGLAPFLRYTRLRYRALARRVAAQIADYQASGAEVLAVVGVGASPSCGVATTVDMAAALGPVAGCPVRRLDRQVVNDAIASAARPGHGIFIGELARALDRRGLGVPLLEHDLRSEWPGSTLIPGPHPATPATRSAASAP